MKVAVVGAGVVGLCAAWALNRDGHEVEVFDQGLIPNPDSASFDEHRLIRSFYADQPGYCRMVDEAFPAWERLWRDLGASHYEEAGTLALCTAPDDWADRSAATLEALGKPARRLDRHELDSLAPHLLLPAGCWGLYDSRGGLLLADRIVTDLADHLAQRGVALRPDTRIAAIDAESGQIELARGGSERFDAAVAATGAWTGKLLPDAVDGVTPRRQVVAYLEPPARFRAAWERSPILVHLQNDTDLYAAPPLRGTRLKVGCALYKRPGDPDDPRVLGAEEPAAVLRYFAGQFKEFESYRAVDGRICYYAWSPDERFVARHTGRLLSVTGCTGHMFKFGALMGERIAAVVTGRLAPAPFIRWAAGEEVENAV